MSTKKVFALERDQFQNDGNSYLEYLSHIGDLLNLKLLKPEKFIQRKQNVKGGITILDLACGPGNAGNFLTEELGSSLKINTITFVDINSDRLQLIRDRSVPEEIIESDIFDFLASTTKYYDLIVLRYAIYYFSQDSKRDLLLGISQIISSGGCLVIASFGIKDSEVDFLTKLHTKAMAFKNVIYDGKYISRNDLQDSMEQVGFSDFEFSKGLTTWDVLSFSKKFGLNKVESIKLKQWTTKACKKFDIPIKERDGNLFFEINTFVLKGIKD